MNRVYLLLRIMSTVVFIISIAYGQDMVLPKEKAYLHIDRINYAPGEIIYYSAYVVSEGQKDSPESGVLYVELIDAESNHLIFQQIELSECRAAGTIQLPYDLHEQNVLLRAYTSYMRNFGSDLFFKQNLNIVHSAEPVGESTQPDQIELVAFPEGGNLLVGVKTVVGVKLTKGHRGIADRIYVYENDKVISTIETNEYGFGKFSISANNNSKYLLRYESTEALIPKPMDTGVHVQCRTSEDKIAIEVKNSPDINLGSYQIMILAHGEILYHELIKNPVLELDKAKLPAGLITIAVLDELDRPVAERLVFNHFGLDDLFIEVDDSEATYPPRALTELPIEIYDIDGYGIESTLSVSVVDHRYYQEQKGIVASLLLDAEIRGYIENPNQYVLANQQELIDRTDLLLLTQGWRKYDLSNDIDIKYPIEEGLSLSGRIVKQKNVNEGVKAFGSLTIMNNNFQLIPIESNSRGYFSLDNLSLSDTTSLFFQMGTKKPKSSDALGTVSGKTNLDLLLNRPEQHPVDQEDLIFLHSLKPHLAQSDSSLYRVKNDNPDEAWYVDQSLLLNEVTIKEKKFDEWVDYYEDVTEYSRPDTRVFTDSGGAIESYIDLYSVLNGRVPGIEVVGSIEIDGLARDELAGSGIGNQPFSKSRKSVIIRGRSTGLTSSTQSNNAAKFMLNGNFISTTLAESINPMDIAYIDVLRSQSQLSRYGELGAGGVIAIYLKPPGHRSRDKAKENKSKGVYKKYMGYNIAKDFYKPTYGADGTYEKSTNRRTIHWEPLLDTNEDGEAILSFYTSDYLGTYHINIQGLTKKGMPLNYQTSFVVDDGL